MGYAGSHSWEVFEAVPPQVLTRTPASLAARLDAGPAADRPPAVPCPSATLVLLRERDGLEAWLLRRSRGMHFGGVWAFPGGKVEPADEQTSDPPLSCVRRECREETGLDLESDEWTGGEPLRWARWITPEHHPYRFDTWFFLVLAPAGTQPDNLTTEADRAEWMPVAELLAADRAAVDAEVALMPPTRAVLSEIELLGSWQRICTVARDRVIETVAPRRVRDGAGWRASHPLRDGTWT